MDRGDCAAIAGRRCQSLIRNRPAQTWLVSGAGSLDLPGVARERSVARLARLPSRGGPDRNPQGAGELPRSLARACHGHVLLERNPPRCRGEPRCLLVDRVVHMDLAFDDQPAGDRPEHSRGGLRPAILLGPCSRCGPLRGRDQLLVGLRCRLKGLLHVADHRDFALPDHGLQGQHLLLASSRDRSGRERGCLEPRPVVHEDLRQGSGGVTAGDQEPPPARQPR